MFNVAEKLTIQVPLYVNNGVKTEDRSWTSVDRETGEEKENLFKAHLLNGVMITDQYGPGTFKKLNIDINPNGYNGAITPVEVFQKFAEHMKDLMDGTKYLLADTTLVPKGNRDSQGAYALYPVLNNIQVVESDEDTKAFIHNYLNAVEDDAEPEERE